jgi:hypothetical protein
VRAGPPYEPPATPYRGQFMAACALYLRAGHVGESNCALFVTRRTIVLLSAVKIEDAVTTCNDRNDDRTNDQNNESYRTE